jgi:hypothetical protein
MAIIFSSWDTVSSEYCSPFMNPVLYFNVSGASAITNPTAEIEIVGGTETINIEACYEKTVSNLHSFFVDLSDVMKYILRRFDGIDYPDNLEFINGNLLQKFDEYVRQIDIDVYFERGTANEQTITKTNYWCYLSDKYPYTRGFNLYNLIYDETPIYLKWGKDTYNAIFMFQRAVTHTIKLNGATLYSATGSNGYYQLKFSKVTVLLQQGLNTLTIDYGSPVITTTKTFYIDYDPTCTTKHNLCWQHPQLGYVSYPFEGAMVTETSVSKGLEIEKVFTSMVNVSQLTEQLGYKKSKTITLRAKVEKKYWPLFEDLYNSRHVYLYTGTSGENDTLASWMECRVTGGYSDNDTRNAKIFTVELQAAAQFPISF